MTITNTAGSLTAVLWFLCKSVNENSSIERKQNVAFTGGKGADYCLYR